MRKLFVISAFCFFLVAAPKAWAFLGVGPDTIKQGINKFAADFFQNPSQATTDAVSGAYVVNIIFKGLANACFAGLVYVYNKIGTILIPIPDLADSRTYVGFAGGLVHDIYGIMVVLGIFVGLVVFISHAGMLASGLGGRELTATAVVRLVVAMTLMVAWPTIYSFFNQMATSAGYLIFGQNTTSVMDVLKGINNLDQGDTAQNGQPSNSNPSAFSSPRDSLAGNINNVIVVAKMIGILLCLIGIMYGGYRFSTGDPAGLKIASGALLGVLFVVGAEHLANYFLNQAQPLQPLTNNVTGNPTANPVIPNAQVMSKANVLDYVGTQTSIMASFLKIIVSFWGLFICIGVLLSKFFQVASLIVIFFLGPIFCGLAASPRTEHIAKQGFLLMLKYQLFSVIWAIALMVLYIIGSINFGAETLGVGNLLSAFAILAGLQIVQNSEAFSSIFTSGAGVSVGSARDTWSNFSKAMIAGAVVGGIEKTGEALEGKKSGLGQATGKEAVGTILGGAIGSVIPVLGTATGAKMGRNLFRMGNAVGAAATAGGGGDYGGGGGSLARAVGDLAGEQKSQRIASQGRSTPSRSSGPSSGGTKSSRAKNPPRRG